MNKGISIGLLIVGLVLIAFGFSATDSISSDISRFFTGAPTEKAVWLLIVGVICAATGATGAFRGGSAA